MNTRTRREVCPTGVFPSLTSPLPQEGLFCSDTRGTQTPVRPHHLPQDWSHVFSGTCHFSLLGHTVCPHCEHALAALWLLMPAPGMLGQRWGFGGAMGHEGAPNLGLITGQSAHSKHLGISSTQPWLWAQVNLKLVLGLRVKRKI